MQDLFNDLWGDQDVISVNHVVDITLPVGCFIHHLNCSLSGVRQIALFIIGVAGKIFILLYSLGKIPDPVPGFGRSVSWKEDGAIIPPGHKMTYKDALHVVTNDILLKLMFPDWVLGLTPRVRKVKLGFEELHVCL